MKKTQNKQKGLGNKGFSLVELIVVIAIMAVLVGILAPALIKNVEKSRESKDLTNLDHIYTAIQTAYADEKARDAAITTGTWTAVAADSTTDFTKAIGDALGSTTLPSFSSKSAKNKSVFYSITAQGKISVKVADSASGNAVKADISGNEFSIE